MPELSERHALVSLCPSAWPRVFEQTPHLANHPFVREWAASGYPVIRRRRLTGEPTRHCLPVGLPTPPAAGKQRIGFTVFTDTIAHIDPPTALDAVLESDRVPSVWRDTLGTVCEATSVLGIETRVFGSLLWQYLTSMSYVGPSSDVDLLWNWPAGRLDGLDRLLDALTRIDAQGAPRIDGEIVVEGRAVLWRELARAAGDTPVLVKTGETTQLWTRDRWLALDAVV